MCVTPHVITYEPPGFFILSTNKLLKRRKILIADSIVFLLPLVLTQIKEKPTQNMNANINTYKGPLQKGKHNENDQLKKTMIVNQQRNESVVMKIESMIIQKQTNKQTKQKKTKENKRKQKKTKENRKN